MRHGNINQKTKMRTKANRLDPRFLSNSIAFVLNAMLFLIIPFSPFDCTDHDSFHQKPLQERIDA